MKKRISLAKTARLFVHETNVDTFLRASQAERNGFISMQEADEMDIHPQTQKHQERGCISHNFFLQHAFFDPCLFVGQPAYLTSHQRHKSASMP